MSISDIQMRLISLQSRLECENMRHEAALVEGILSDLDTEVKSIKRQCYLHGFREGKKSD